MGSSEAPDPESRSQEQHGFIPNARNTLTARRSVTDTQTWATHTIDVLIDHL